MSSLRNAIRALRTSPVVSSVVVMSLALGIGANAAMFSIVDALLLRDLPVRYANRLVMLFDDVNGSGFWSGPMWEAIKRRPGLFDGAFAWGGVRFNLAERGEVDPADGLWASGAMFETLGVDALFGRTFTPVDDAPGGGPEGPVAVLSHEFWQRRFAGDPAVIGKPITLNGTVFTVVGITGPRFFGPEVGRTFDVAVPLNTEPLVRGQRSSLADHGSWLQFMIRLAPGESAAQATARFRIAQPDIANEARPIGGRPQDRERYLSAPLTLRPGATVSGIRDQYQKPLVALMASVALTLLIACGNIANLQLARATSRRHEFSVRSALGASSTRLGRQVLLESGLLAATGALLGIAVAVIGSRFLVAQISATTNRVFNRVFVDVGLDWRVIAFTGAVAVLTTLLFGTGPALRMSRVAPIEAMKERGRGSSSGRRAGLAGSLVTMQVALSLVLLVGAGLFVRTFLTLVNRPTGLEPGSTLVIEVGTERAGTDSAARREMYSRLIDVARDMPGVTTAALSTITPVSGENSTRFMSFPGRPELPERERRVWINMITPGWFNAVGMPLATGRDFDSRDRVGATRAVVVNEAFVKKYFDGVNPIGQRIAESQVPNASPLEIVGVVRDAVYRSLREPVPPTMYWNLLQQVRPGAVVVLMVRAPAATFAVTGRRVADAILRVNPNLTTTIRPLGDVVDAALSQERLVARLSGFFGVLALVLAALGLYGITSYSVTQRQTELGIRMALGTSPRGVARLVMARVGRLLGIGLLTGGLVSWWIVQLVQGMLFGLDARDLPTMMAAAAVLSGVAMLAGFLPARRASRIDPAQVLRDG